MATEAREVLPTAPASREELPEYFERRYGKPVAEALSTSVSDRKKALDELHKTGLNGKADDVMKEYMTYEQEFARRDKLDKTWAQKGWRWSKDVVKGAVDVATAPMRFVWNNFKEHPVLTTLAVGGVVLGGSALALYLSGNMEAFMAYLGAKHLAAAGTAAAPGGAIATGAAPELGAGAAGAKAALILPEL